MLLRTNRPSARWQLLLARDGEALLPSVVYAAAISLLGPWWSVFEFDSDEGINLMKAALVAAGHSLYGEIWSDQPPVMTLLLGFVHKVAGPSVGAARGTVLGFACLLIWALFRIVRRAEGSSAAWLAVGVLAAGASFQRLSVSVLIGLPAVALAVLALDQALAGAARGTRWPFWIAGALFGLSAQTKLFTLVLAPVLAAAALLPANPGPGRQAWRGGALRVVECLAVAAAVFLAVAWATDEEFLEQLVAPHVEPRLAEAFVYQGGLRRLWSMIWDQPAYPLLAAAGLVIAPPWRRPARWLPLLWLAAASAALAGHTPLWYHHLLLLAVPLAWLGGLAAHGIGGLWQRPRPAGNLARAAIAAIALIYLVGRAASDGVASRRLFVQPAAPVDRAAVSSLMRFATDTRWVLTDRPMDAYRAGLRVPPPVAVFSLKRVRGRYLTADGVLSVLEEYRPEQVSYRRLFMGERVKAVLERAYVKIEAAERQDHHVLPGLLGE